MSNTKFTPKPWHRNIKPATKYNTIFAGRNTHIAYLATSGLTPEEVEANCDLIIKAPEMYQALHDLFEQCAMTHKYWGENCNREQADDAIRRGQELLDQIEGRKVQS